MSYLINEGVLRKYIEDNEEIEIIIPNEVTHIGCGAFTECHYLKKITFPEKVEIGYRAFQICPVLENLVFEKKPEFARSSGFSTPTPFYDCPKLRLTTEQIQQTGSISNVFAKLDTNYNDDELAWLRLYQGTKDWDKKIESQISSENADVILKKMIAILLETKKVTKAVANRSVAFVLMHFDTIEKQNVFSLIDCLETRNKEASQSLKQDPRLCEKSTDNSRYAEYEDYCTEKYIELDGDKVFSDYKITGFNWPEIKYIDGTVAPVIVLKYLIVQYALNHNWENHPVHFYIEADKIADTLDKVVLNDAMLFILENAPVRAHRILYFAICRYLNPERFNEILKYNYSHKQEEAAFITAAILNISNGAVSFLGQKRQITRYAENAEILALAVPLLSKSQKNKVLDYALDNTMTESIAVLLNSTKKK